MAIPVLSAQTAKTATTADTSRSGGADAGHYRPAFRVPQALEAIERHVVPGGDAFPEEAIAQAIADRLNALGAAWRRRAAAAGAEADDVAAMLAPEFKGSRLAIAAPTIAAPGSPKRASAEIEMTRADSLPSAATLDRAAFRRELASMLGAFASIDVAEFLITRIDVEGAAATAGAGAAAAATADTRSPAAVATVIVRADLTGTAAAGGRLQQVQHWRMRWRLAPAGSPSSTAARPLRSAVEKRGDGPNEWTIVEWVALDGERSHAAAPVFVESTTTAFGGIEAFRTQLMPGLDAWLTRLDSAFASGGMGHHGVSVGDVDGDGLDDLYVSQPAGLPNRLFRNNGDGTFADITDAAGLAVLDGTSQSIFADIDNDGDQDLILVTRTLPLLLLNDGNGGRGGLHFTRDASAFRFAQPLRGTLTSASMADYDRDGFVDLYLCAYSFLIGASEDKAGPPAPYHDAQNGPPNVLLRNDGHGHFVDVTAAAGLDEHNDRFSFAAAWGDYDADGWPDLLVANDFGRKNLYHNEGVVNGEVRFRDVAAAAGVEDYGAGMSATFVDYDNDGRLDIYTGNMWTATGQRVTAQAGFMPDAPAEVREHYQRHARGNALFRNRGDGTFEDVTLQAGAAFGRWAWSSDAIDIDNDGWQDLFITNGMFTRDADAQRRPRRGADDTDPRRESKLARAVEPDAIANDQRRRDAGAGAGAGAGADVNVDGLFWRQVVARSPLVRELGTPYDDGWRATNRLLMTHGAQASRERDVLLHNNGAGGFDDISGTAGLDLDTDGRSFAVFDYDRDGDADLVVMAPRASPQLRLFRNDMKTGHASLAIHLTGDDTPTYSGARSSNRAGGPTTTSTGAAPAAEPGATAGAAMMSNRDAIGARVTVDTDRVHLTRIVTAGSGFISQHSKTLLFGLGDSQRITKLTIAWPSGLVQTLSSDVPLNRRLWIEEGREPTRSEAFIPSPRTITTTSGGAKARMNSSSGTWLYEPYPAADFVARGLDGRDWSLAAFTGRPAVIAFWSTASDSASASRAVLAALARVRSSPASDNGRENGLASGDSGERPSRKASPVALVATPLLALAVAVDAANEANAANSASDESTVRQMSQAFGLPVALATDAVASTWSLLHRYLFDRREDLPLPVVFLLDARGEIVKVYRDAASLASLATDIAQSDAPPADRLARALPFPGTFHTSPGTRSYFQYGLELSEQGYDAPALRIFERVADADPTAITFFNLGTLYMKGAQPTKARAAFERALALSPDDANAHNSLGALLAQSGEVPSAIEHFRAALQRKPDFADALNNLGFALFQSGQPEQARALYERALALQADFPEALNNLGIFYGRQGDLERALTFFQQAVAKRSSYGEAANNLALVLAARGDVEGAIAVLQKLLQENPAFEMGYVTLSRTYLKAGRRTESIQTLERLLQRNPTHPLGLQVLREIKGA